MNRVSREELEKENKKLKEQLWEAILWMKRQIQESTLRIGKEKISKFMKKIRKDYLDAEQVEIIKQEIENYFGKVIEKSPKNTTERIIDAELYWFQLQKYPNMDGTAIIMTYQKILDLWVDEYIVKPYRKYEKILTIDIARPQNANETILYNAIYKKHTISFSKLFPLIQKTTQSKIVNHFHDFLQQEEMKYWKLFHNEIFFKKYTQIVNSEVFWKKRHSDKISFIEAKETRKIIIGDFQDHTGILYLLLEKSSK